LPTLCPQIEASSINRFESDDAAAKHSALSARSPIYRSFELDSRQIGWTQPKFLEMRQLEFIHPPQEFFFHSGFVQLREARIKTRAKAEMFASNSALPSLPGRKSRNSKMIEQFPLAVM